MLNRKSEPHRIDRVRTPTACVVVVAALLLSTVQVEADTSLGALTCDRIPGTTTNLIITSKANVRCTFEGQGEAEQWYVGETGVALGLDLKWTESETINFAVLSTTREYTPEGAFLAGEYAGAKADAAVGVGAGAAVLIGGSDETTALQPAVTTGEGVGISAGLGFLTLKPDALNVARIATPRGDEFTQALYSAYFGVALEEYRAGRFESSDHFAGKSVAAANGQPPAPDRVPTQGLAGEDIGTLSKARERLVAAQQSEFVHVALIESAKAQSAFDCWLRAVDAANAADRALECKQRFDAAIAPLEQAIGQKVSEAFTKEQLMKPRRWALYFDTDVHELDSGAKAVVADIVNVFSSYKEARIYIAGHTDRVGAKDYNLQLSKDRATSTQKALVRAGVPLEWIRAVGYGKSRPFRISTNPHDATNRRVNVWLEPLALKDN